MPSTDQVDSQPTRPFVGRWYLAGAVSLTVLWLVVRGFAPATGLTRSYHYPYATLDRSTEPVLELLTTPVVEERITAVDLAFIDARSHPARNYLVRWNGVWFSPRPERIDFHAAADDGVVLRLDGEVVIERNSEAGMATAVRTVELDAGAHRLDIDHWQHGGASRLHLEWAPAGGDPVPLRPSRLFPEDPGAPAYWVLAASPVLQVLVLLIWGAIPALLFGRMVHREASALTRQELSTRLRVLLLPALLGPSQLLVFGPWTVHATNRTEFLVSFWNLAPRWLWLLGPIVGGLAALGIVLPGRWFPRYVAALCAFGVLLWVQGNLLVADYGLLDGAGLDLASHAWRAPAEVGLWIGGIALAAVFAGPVTRAAPLASALLMALQAAVLLLPAIAPAADRASAPRSARAADTGWQLPPERIYELSRTRNLIHIVLDMFPSHVFAEIAAADRPAFDRDWSGFTFFSDHLGAFRTTRASMPAMLAGVAYRNELPFNEFRARRANVSVFRALGQQGYQLRWALPFGYDRTAPYLNGLDASTWYTIPSPYGSQRDYLAVSAAQLLDLSLFRHAPHDLKASVYNEQQWLLQPRVAARMEVEAATERAAGDIRFLREFAGRITPGVDDPVYALLHVIAPHPPIVVDADCRYLGKRLPVSTDSFDAQARCALSGVQALLDSLRALDLYDRSAIVVTSDHGLAAMTPDDHPLYGMRSPAGPLDRIATDATPLLAIKPVGARGPLRTSDAPDRDHRPAGHAARPRGAAEYATPGRVGAYARSSDASRAHVRPSRVGEAERLGEPVLRRAPPVLRQRTCDEPRSLAPSAGALRADRRPRGATPGASGRPRGGRGRDGGPDRPSCLPDGRLRGLLRGAGHSAYHVRRAQGVNRPVTPDGDRTNRRRRLRGAPTCGRYMAHARVSCRGTRGGRQPVLCRVAGEPGPARWRGL